MSKTRMTHRIVRALQHPGVHILGHPTGRLIGKRGPYPVDMVEIIKAARDYGVLLEINAQPDRNGNRKDAARQGRGARWLNLDPKER